jgi:hypothetical protein
MATTERRKEIADIMARPSFCEYARILGEKDSRVYDPDHIGGFFEREGAHETFSQSNLSMTI